MLVEEIEPRILLIRGQRVMLDSHLAELYGVATKALDRAVKRNQHRFPPDFVFQLTPQEADSLRFQFGASKNPDHLRFQVGTSKTGRGGRRYHRPR